MEKIYFSAASRGFFPDCMRKHYNACNSWPDDAVEIPQEAYQRLIDGQSQGKQILADDSGYPVLADPLPPSPEEYIAVAAQEQRRLLAVAAAAIAPLQDALDLGIATEQEKVIYDAWRRYRVLLNRVDISAAPDIHWPVVPA